jgi:hypothetical protein
MIFKHPKQHLSQSAELAMMDGPIFIVVNDEVSFGFCPNSKSIAWGVEEETIKVNSVEEEIDIIGVNADDDVVGRRSHPFFPFIVVSSESFGPSPF